jgi:hypothetical protein
MKKGYRNIKVLFETVGNRSSERDRSEYFSILWTACNNFSPFQIQRAISAKLVDVLSLHEKRTGGIKMRKE